jgi:hypothetical protein
MIFAACAAAVRRRCAGNDCINHLLLLVKADEVFGAWLYLMMIGMNLKRAPIWLTLKEHYYS